MFELFPTATLDTSILTAVLVGLLIVWLLQEWLGWGFTGLVVPGYLASIIAIQPLTGGVVIAEALATWLVMLALSDALPRWWPWSPLFGRDRFFLALLGSVGVRLAMEGAVFPLLAERYQLRVAADLHSMGLVVVPLLAYAIWRSGPVRALPRLGVPLLLTWALLEYVLLARTNLSLGSFQLTYEDLALDFVSSPRAYVLLLFGAWLGSITNLRYGWDFGGIIVPGLLALCWLQPERLVATVGESLVIYGALRLVLRMPALREVNLAGGRTLVLAMLIAYSLKFLLGHLLGAGWPGLRLRQLFGFGYLLPALMALRMVRSGDPFRTIVPSLATSLAGFLGGTALAYALAVALPAESEPQLGPEDDEVGADSLLLAAWADRGTAPLHLERLVDSPVPVLVRAGDGFGALWLRPEGRPLVLSARVGRGPDAQAALALARTIDARGVLLCAQHGPSCDEARRRLGLLLPVLSLDRGPTSLLLASGRMHQVLSPELLEESIGAVPMQRSEGGSKLVLSEAAAWRLAATTRGQRPNAWEHPLAAPLAASSTPRQGAAGLVREDLVGSTLAWAGGQPWASDALPLATTAATALGVRLTAQTGRASIIADDWRAVLRQGGQPLIITVPTTEDDPNAAALALSLGEALDAALVILDSPPKWGGQDQAPARLAHQALLGGLEALGPDARVITVRGIRDIADPGADIVLSLGRPAPDGSNAPPWAVALAQRLESLDMDVAWYDATPERMSFRDGSNPARAAATAATGGEAQLTLFATSPVRARAAPPDPSQRLFAALDGSQLPLWTWSASELAAHASPVQAGQRWEPWLRAVDGLLASGQEVALAGVWREGRALDAETGIVCEPVAGCRWLAALRCEQERCDGVVTGLSGAPAPGPAALAIDRLLLADGQLQLADLPAPGGAP